MRLQKFTVERFRSIVSSSSFELKNRTIIVGPNNQGKSNLLKALVLSLKILAAIAEDPGKTTAKGNTLVYSPDTIGQDYNYSSNLDYPISLQCKKEEKKESHFELTFSLSQEEKKDFKKEVGDPLSDTISVRLCVTEWQVLFEFVTTCEHCSEAVSRNMLGIAQFITKKIYICYIDAERTASMANSIIEDLLFIETRKISQSEAYERLQEQLRELYRPHLKKISEDVRNSLQQFIPSVQNAVIDLGQRGYRQSLRPRLYDCRVEVDDGVNTLLERKGSGVQSLVALCLAQYVSLNSSSSEDFILAIEEPESHLHPNAIHEIRSVLRRISEKNQLILTTHSPLFVETQNPHMNIIVKDNKAMEASKISEVREVLGVSPSDNLIAADVVLIVEGGSDENILPHLFSLFSKKLKKATDERRLHISSVGGTSSVSNYVKFMRYNLCSVHVCVDGDEAGKNAINTLLENKIISDSEYTCITMNGLKESEIEDLIDPGVYAGELASEFGVDCNHILDLNYTKKKWTKRIKAIFEDSGKCFDEVRVKTFLSKCLKRKNEIKLIEHRRSSFDSLCRALEEKIFDNIC